MQTEIKMTSQRELILAELRSTKSHPTADELFGRVRNKLPRIGLATVYRNLEKLSEAGIVRKLEIGGERMRFDGDLSRHDHVICTGCGRVDDIFDARPKELSVYPVKSGGYEITGCKVEYFGICPGCKKETNTKKLN